MSTFALMVRTGYAASGASGMEAQYRRTLDTFGTDARMAIDVRWTDRRSITLYVATSGSANAAVTYAYDNLPDGPTIRSFSGFPVR